MSLVLWPDRICFIWVQSTYFGAPPCTYTRVGQIGSWHDTIKVYVTFHWKILSLLKLNPSILLYSALDWQTFLLVYTSNMQDTRSGNLDTWIVNDWAAPYLQIKLKRCKSWYTRSSFHHRTHNQIKKGKLIAPIAIITPSVTFWAPPPTFIHKTQ